MVKRKRTKEQTTIYKTLHRKQKIEQHKLNNSGGPRYSGMVRSSSPTSRIRRVTIVANLVISHECEQEREMITSDHL